ncbi:MAG: CPBP family intramembrane metalloprotease [Alphaproteobacteria bacterium]|nr:CPBP family intramembrane metalloprotease [Alphaproteobacteria bacterium]
MDNSNGYLFQPAQSGRLRAFAVLRVLGFVAAMGGLFLGTGFLLRHILLSLGSFEKLAFAGEFIAAICTAAATLIMARATGRRFGDFGFRAQGRPRNFLIGLAVGIALLGTQLAVMHALGVLSFGGVQAEASSLVYSGVFYAGLFLTVGYTEEAMWRGYALVELSRAISFWPAAILLSVIFGAAHLMNGGENHVGALVAFLFGIVLAFSFRQTGSLWLALGLHSGWDYAESFIFGVPDSGVVLSGRLFHSVLHGPDWLTGGTVGPEGSILVAAPLLAMVLVSWLLRARQDVAPN